MCGFWFIPKPAHSERLGLYPMIGPTEYGHPKDHGHDDTPPVLLDCDDLDLCAFQMTLALSLTTVSWAKSRYVALQCEGKYSGDPARSLTHSD